jgi:hypothetical protein
VGPELSEIARRILTPDWIASLHPALRQRHEVRGLAYAIARAHQQASQSAVEDRTAYLAALAFNEARLARLAPILSALDRAGLKVVPMKGIALMTPHYGDPGARYMVDVDLLCAEEELAAAGALLEHQGLTRLAADDRRAAAGALHDVKYQDGAIHVELHHRLWHELAITSDPRPLIARARRTTLAGAPSWALDPIDHLYVVLVHAALHGFAGNPLWRTDACLLAADIDGAWEAVLAPAETTRARVAVLAAIDELALTFPSVVHRPTSSHAHLRRAALELMRPWLLKGEGELGPLASRIVRPLLVDDAHAAATLVRQKLRVLIGR